MGLAEHGDRGRVWLKMVVHSQEGEVPEVTGATVPSNAVEFQQHSSVLEKWSRIL